MPMKKGTLKSINDRMLEVVDDDGNTSWRWVAVGATVTLDGARAKLTDLRAGDKLTLTGDPASLVAALRK